MQYGGEAALYFRYVEMSRINGISFAEMTKNPYGNHLHVQHNARLNSHICAAPFGVPIVKCQTKRGTGHVPAGYIAPETDSERRSRTPFNRPKYDNKIFQSVAVTDLDNDGVVEYIQGLANQDYLKYMGDKANSKNSDRVNMIALKDAGWTDLLEIRSAPKNPDTKWDFVPPINPKITFMGDIEGCLHSSDVRVGPLNQDEYDDFVLVCSGLDMRPFPGGISYVFLSTGKGTYEGKAIHDELRFDHRGELADVNNDGYLDILLAQFDRIVVHYNDGKGNFGDASVIAKSIGGLYSVGAADFNNDGLTDLIIGGHEYDSNGGGTYKTQILWNIGSESFSNSPKTYIPSIKGHPIVLDFLIHGKHLFVLRAGENYVGGAVQQIDLETAQQVGLFSRPGPHAARLQRLEGKGDAFFGSLEAYRRTVDFYIIDGQMQSVY